MKCIYPDYIVELGQARNHHRENHGLLKITITTYHNVFYPTLFILESKIADQIQVKKFQLNKYLKKFLPYLYMFIEKKTHQLFT